MSLRSFFLRLSAVLLVTIPVGGMLLLDSEGRHSLRIREETFASAEIVERTGGYGERSRGASGEEVGGGCRTTRVPVLMYHHIRACPAGSMCADNVNHLAYGLSVDPELFERQMRYLRERGYRTVLSEDLANESVPCRSFMLTFDDGYEDAYRNALPVLRKYGFHGSFAVIIDRIGKPDYMDLQQLEDIRDAGHEIAAHTSTHRALPSLSNGEVYKEIVGSKVALEELLSVRVLAFVYPAGQYDGRAVMMAREAGYVFAFTTHPGVTRIGRDRLEMQRLRVSNTVNADLENISRDLSEYPEMAS